MHDYELEQLDVKTAFLHGELEEEIYMEQFLEKKICFKRSDYDSCVYLKFVNGLPIYLLLYVDDMLIAAKDKAQIEKLKGQLNNEFDMKDLGYVEKVLQRFNMHNAKPVNTPLAAHFKLSSALCPQWDAEDKYMSKVPYSSAVGSLMYAMVALSVVSRYMADPGKKHGKAVQWIFRYLRGTSNVCLEFEKSKYGLVGYVDSDYAGDLDKRRSLTGCVFSVGGCAISWKASL
ncbi:retrotransposon protein, putative, ty1-copia subclass [Tanacetum coccineum]